uniref:PKD domain-containing protein n=1 Tax=Cupriavidus yeoncheonensis TaxID=1462994 RepID=UPI003F497968
MKTLTKHSAFVMAILAAAALSACGGGESGSPAATSGSPATEPGTSAAKPKPNATPVANAGNAQTVVTGSTVTLNASASSDADGDTLKYSWALTAPAGSHAALSSTSVVAPTFVADIPGTYYYCVNNHSAFRPQHGHRSRRVSSAAAISNRSVAMESAT